MKKLLTNPLYFALLFWGFIALAILVFWSLNHFGFINTHLAHL